MKKIAALLISLIIIAALGYISYMSYTTSIQIKKLNDMVSDIKNTVNNQLSSNAHPKQNLEREREANIIFGKIQTLISENKITQAKTDLSKFMEEYGNTRIAGRARRLSEELSIVGKDTPKNWGIEKWVQGKDDIDMNSNQNTILLVFWEEWCGYCRREMPNTQKLFAEYKDSGLKVLGLTKISRSATLEKVNAFLKDNNIQFPIAKEDGSISEYFQVQGIPASALVHNGKIVWRGHPSRFPIDMIKAYQK